MTEQNLNTIKDMLTWGDIRILYLPSLNRYYKVIEFIPCKTVNGIDYHQLKGQDITTQIINFDSNHDKNIFERQLEKMISINIKFNKSEPFWLFD